MCIISEFRLETYIVKKNMLHMKKNCIKSYFLKICKISEFQLRLSKKHASYEKMVLGHIF